MTRSLVYGLFVLVFIGGLAACGEPAIKGPQPHADEDDHEVVASQNDHEEPTTTAIPPTEDTAPTPTATPRPSATPPPPTATPSPLPPTATPVEEAADAAPPDPASIGDPANGATLFTNNGCNACHAVDQPTTLVGPSLMGLASVAGERVEGQSAVEYLRLSIVAPNDHLVEGFTAGLMPSTFSMTLSDDQINDLIAYLLTLDGAP